MKITLYYMGNINSTVYKARQATVKTFQKWMDSRSKRVKDVAFILTGVHTDLESFSLESYLIENGLKKFSKYDILDLV